MLRINRSLLFLFALITLPARADFATLEFRTAPPTLHSSDGQEVLLPGLRLPDDNPLAQSFADLLRQQQYQLTPAGPPDRWQRLPVRATGTDGQDLALQLLEQGLAQINPQTATPTQTERVAEAHAMDARRGLWGQECCRKLGGLEEIPVGQWRVIWGTVTAVSTRRQMVYVNFGTDWQTDFTLLLPPRLAHTLEAEHWVGRLIEARGVTEWYYGPAIRISDATQIQLPEVKE